VVVCVVAAGCGCVTTVSRVVVEVVVAVGSWAHELRNRAARSENTEAMIVSGFISKMVVVTQMKSSQVAAADVLKLEKFPGA
jgi:hypothetical protein